MREKLIELLGEVRLFGIRVPERPIEETMRLVYEQIADHLLASGQVIVLPCKVGDEIFRIVKPTNAVYKPFVPQLPDKVEPCGIYYKNLMGAYSYIPFDELGKTVFLTREDAEAALKEWKG